MFSYVKKGDTVHRMLVGTIPMDLKVTEVTDDLIITGGGWEFDRKTGHEVDDMIPILVSHLMHEGVKDAPMVDPS